MPKSVRVRTVDQASDDDRQVASDQGGFQLRGHWFDAWFRGTSSVSLACDWIRGVHRDRFLNFVDLVNRLDAEAKVDRRWRRADSTSRLDFHVRDGLDDLPFRAEQRAATVPLNQQAPQAYVGR